MKKIKREKKKGIENREEKNQERIRKKESTTQEERKKKKLSLYTKERDMRSAFEPMNLLMYKEVYSHETNHNSSLPSTIISLLQEPKDFATHIVKSNDGASKLDVLGKFNVSATFNVPDLFLFDIGDDSRTNFSEEEGNDRVHNAKDLVDGATRNQVKDIG